MSKEVKSSFWSSKVVNALVNPLEFGLFIATEWNPTQAGIFVLLGRGLQLDSLSSLLRSASFMPHCLQISTASLVRCPFMGPRNETVYTYLPVPGWTLLFLELPHSLGSSKGFQNSSHTWGNCQPIIWNSRVMQFSTWALESGPGF